MINSIYIIEEYPTKTVLVPYDLNKDHRLYNDGTMYDYAYLNDRIIRDFKLAEALTTLTKFESTAELYDVYLETRHPTYTYH